ncbi:PfkB family carbohydrate kinase [Parasedimentitalea huanghaiensis]|uniref:Carbohydrate kinase n=1 Tax=Parasedimentitalea huanghaiensis TaxID=2682100 RepID=A0A6L6WM30_9RHOB|nr:carbohydrate kinase [Zongyanglinia huanghaiensis]
MILCCGEALIDMIPSPTTGGGTGFVPHSGGAVFNTAIALGRLGVQTGLLSGISSDMFGQQLMAALKASQVNTSNIIGSDRPTTLAFVQLIEGQAAYSFFDENTAGRMLDLQEIPILPAGVSTLFFGGISLACEPCADAYAALLERDGGDRVVMLDPNIRPGFIQDETRYRARIEQMIARADIVKVSDEDLNWLVPGSMSLRQKAKIMLEKGPSVIILTRGSEGAMGFLPNGTEVRVAAEEVQVVDTVGAGDTFNAGVLAKLSDLDLLRKGELKTLPVQSLEEALVQGAKTAAIAVSRSGANPPWADEL